MNTSPVISRADTAAHQALSALHALCFSEPWPAQEFRSLLSAANVCAFLAHDARTANSHCGFIVLRHAADEAEIITLGVIPAARRKGTATALLAAAVAASEAEAVRFLFLEVAEDNAAARRFYRSHGFAEAGRRAGYYSAADGAVQDAIVMRRTIRTGSRA